MFGKSISCSATILAVVVFFGKMIIGIFVDPAETEVVKNAYPYMLVCGIMIWTSGFLFRFSLQALVSTV